MLQSTMQEGEKNAYDKPADYLEFSVWELFKDMQS